MQKLDTRLSLSPAYQEPGYEASHAHTTVVYACIDLENRDMIQFKQREKDKETAKVMPETSNMTKLKSSLTLGAITRGMTCSKSRAKQSLATTNMQLRE